MQSMRSALTESVFLLTLNNNIKNSLTYKAYNICYKSNACIIPISIVNNITSYEVIIPKPPPVFHYISFVGIEWNNKEYKFTSSLQVYKEYFLRSTVVLIQ